MVEQQLVIPQKEMGPDSRLILLIQRETARMRWGGLAAASPLAYNLSFHPILSHERNRDQASPRGLSHELVSALSAILDSPKANINTTSVGRSARPSLPIAFSSATVNIASPGSCSSKKHPTNANVSRPEPFPDWLR